MEGTAAGAFVVHDAVVEVAKVLIFIRKRQAVEIVDFLKGFVAFDRPVDAAEDAGNLRAVAAFFEGRQKVRHHDFPFPLKDVVDLRAVLQDLAGRIRDFRAADEDLGLGKDVLH